ncbi:hypothetical protein V22_13810 [Calycomorphotria hydatis]|uniref:Uncharacterized protein n=2 Tax=Calycomorphotria hydatis TaxID=2528027 RepID=A0A517T716_9PLAN|nr:hypothetical protein V22_13810 [Calycomorphotria hydatis]
MRLFLVACFSLAVASYLIGCGDSGPVTYRASGTVTFNGQPVPYGEMSFEPRADLDNAGQQTFVMIKDGKFDTSDAVRGHIGGPHRLRITGYDGKKIENPDEGTVNEQGSLMFTEYVAEVDLEKADSQFEVEIPKSAGLK